jgi:hypothetical protein
VWTAVSVVKRMADPLHLQPTTTWSQCVRPSDVAGLCHTVPVAAAIHRKAGPELYQACLKVQPDEMGRRCRTGEARITE